MSDAETVCTPCLECLNHPVPDADIRNTQKLRSSDCGRCGHRSCQRDVIETGRRILIQQGRSAMEDISDRNHVVAMDTDRVYVREDEET